MTHEQASEILRELGEALREGSTLRIRAVRATLEALAMGVVALDGEARDRGYPEPIDAELEEES
jgi:hypothetical protein